MASLNSSNQVLPHTPDSGLGGNAAKYESVGLSSDANVRSVGGAKKSKKSNKKSKRVKKSKKTKKTKKVWFKLPSLKW